MKRIIIVLIVFLCLSTLSIYAGTGTVEIDCGIENETIDATVNEEITTEPYIQLSCNGLLFDEDVLKGESDVDSFITNLPLGVTTTFELGATNEDLVIYFGGTPLEASNEDVKITIPVGYLLIKGDEENFPYESAYPVTPGCVCFNIVEEKPSLSCTSPANINVKVNDNVDTEVTYSVINDVLMPNIKDFSKDIGNGLTLAYKSSSGDVGISKVTFSITGKATSIANEYYNLQIEEKYSNKNALLSNSACIIKVIEEAKQIIVDEPTPPIVIPKTGVE